MEPCSELSSTAAIKEAPNGEDLLGWSALPLLGRANARPEPWLFVSSPSLGWLSQGPLDDARFARTSSDYSRTWPFSDGSLGGAVIDGDALSRQGNAADLERTLEEACRTAGRLGDVLVVCRHRFVPRRPWAWREYLRPSANRWRRAAAGLGLRTEAAGAVELDGDRIDGVHVIDQDRGDKSQHKAADRVVLRVAASGRREAHSLEAMVAQASPCGTALGIDRMAVRKIGKTAVFLSSASGQRFVMRIARSPIARARATRNFESLVSLHEAGLPNSITCRVPTPAVQGRHAAYGYYVESCMDGRPGPQLAKSPTDGTGWCMEAFDFITSLHAATMQRTTLEEPVVARLVLEPAEQVARHCGSVDTEQQVRRVATACAASLRGRLLPLVRTHGDFTDSNCLFDARGTLTAVVDWEVSLAQGLPFLDLLQLMPIPGETGASPRWQRFDAWLDIWRNYERVVSDPILGRYLRVLDLEPEVIPGLILAQWLTHVGDRIEARRNDERWMRLRVLQPIESLTRTMRD